MHICAAQQHAVIKLFFRVPRPTILWRWNARYDDAIMTFVLFLFFFFSFFFLFFFGGGRGKGGIYITKYPFLLHCLLSISVVIYNVLKSHCFNSWDSYRRPRFTRCKR